LGTVEHAAEVNVHDAVPLLAGHLRELLVGRDPGVVHEHVGRAERLVTDLDHVFDLGAIGDVGPGRDGRPARRFDRIDGVVCRPFR